jgi:hypothetical protein
MWEFAGRGESVTALLRTIVVRLARNCGGGVEYWTELPIPELLRYVLELNEQLRAENEAAKAG